MNKKTWIIFSLICVVIFAGLIFLSQRNKVDVSGVDTTLAYAASEDSGNIADQVFGNKDAKVTIIEYGDFQCPSCGSAHPNIQEITEKHKDDVKFIFRNFPLTSMHPNALAAAAAAEAAGLQGKYWPMHNLLFTNQSTWSNQSVEERTNTFTDLAKQIGLDEKKFVADMASEQVSKKINYDKALAAKDNINSTPSFKLNGKDVSREISNDVVRDKGALLEKAIEEALKSAKK